MNADPTPQAERPALDSLALFRAIPNQATARPGRVRSSFRLNQGADHPEIRLVVSEPEPFEPVPAAELPPALGTPYSGPIDWKLVAAFRGQTAEALTARLGEASSKAAQEELGRAIITE